MPRLAECHPRCRLWPNCLAKPPAAPKARAARCTSSTPPSKHFNGGHGIVGAQVPIATGLGFAHKHKKDGCVAVCYLGDGAVNQGQVYESLNMAALWKLPVLYVIENNKYGMGTSQVSRASASHDLFGRGAGFRHSRSRIRSTA